MKLSTCTFTPGVFKWMARCGRSGTVRKKGKVFLAPVAKYNTPSKFNFLVRSRSLCVVITQWTGAKMAAIRRNRFYGKWSRVTTTVRTGLCRPGATQPLAVRSRGRAGDAPVSVGSPSSLKSKPRPRCRRLQSIFKEIVVDVVPGWLSD